MRHSLIPAALGAWLLAAGPALADARPRVEALAGWDRISLDAGRYGLGSYNRNGLAYGGAVGYDWAMAPLFSLGVDGEIDGSTARYNAGPSTVSVGRDIYLGGRATFTVSPVTNVYAKLGYANGSITANVPAYATSSSRDGLRWGVGVQQSLAPHIYGLLEYRHTGYHDDFSRNQLMTGIGLRF